MVLGYTAQGVHFTMGGKKLRAADFLPQETPDYTTNDRAKLHEGFSAHCQNFASTRHQMWNRMHVWARSVSV
jgi:hypothetical protein